MKDRFGAVSKVIVIILIALIVCSCVMLLFDSAFNGAVGDWFVANFIRYSEWENEGEYYYRETFRWSALKLFITYSAIALVVLWTGSIILTFVLSRKDHAKKVSKDTAKFIRSRLAQPEEMEFIPKEYSHITPYITEMQKQLSDSKLLVLEEVNKKMNSTVQHSLFVSSKWCDWTRANRIESLAIYVIKAPVLMEALITSWTSSKTLQGQPRSK